MLELIKEKIITIEKEIDSYWELLSEYSSLKDSCKCYELIKDIMIYENELLSLNEMLE